MARGRLPKDHSYRKKTFAVLVRGRPHRKERAIPLLVLPERSDRNPDLHFEVIKKRKFIDMARDFGTGPIQGYDPSYDQYPLYAFKMATGSGKTFVMALSIVWQNFKCLIPAL